MALDLPPKLILPARPAFAMPAPAIIRPDDWWKTNLPGMVPGLGFLPGGREPVILEPNINSNTTSVRSSWARVDLSFQLTSGWTVTKAKCDYNRAETLTFFIADRQSAGVFDIDWVEAVSHGGAGVEEFTLVSPYLVPAGEYYIGGFAAGANSVNGTSGVAMAEAAFGTPTTPDDARALTEVTSNVLPLGVTLE